MLGRNLGRHLGDAREIRCLHNMICIRKFYILLDKIYIVLEKYSIV